MISVLRGKTYTIDSGLSENDKYWFVVGTVSIPVRVDLVLGWITPQHDTEPSFTVSDSYMVVEAFLDEVLGWTAGSETCYFVPVFAITEIVETVTDQRMPSYVECLSFDSVHVHEILPELANWHVEEIWKRPVRIDKNLGWRDPLSEEPSFIAVDAGVSQAAFFDTTWNVTTNTPTNIPLFLVTKVYEWRSF